jgi:DNA-binding transcriptional regulator YhcF (GntR family)
MSPTKNPPLTGKLPLKKQVVTRHLRELAATLTPGTRLPSVNELERTFGYANSTIEAALDELRREGVIVRRQGSGTFVADAAPMLPATFVNTNGTATLAPTRPTRLIALTANTRSALYQAEMLQRLEAELQGDEFAPVLVFEADAGRRFERLRQYARESGVLGYLHVGSTDYVANAGMPGVVIGEAPEGGDVSQVVVDN